MGAHRGQDGRGQADLASALGTSPQTAARRRSLLEEQGYLVRKATGKGQRIRSTEESLRVRESQLFAAR